MKKKIVSALMCATMAASLLAGCGSDNAAAPAGSETASAGEATTDGTAETPTTEAEDTNTITGDIDASDAFVVWGWNDDIKNILDNCYAKDKADNYSRIVFVNSGGSDYYQNQIDALLGDEGNELYPDVMGLEIDYV